MSLRALTYAVGQKLYELHRLTVGRFFPKYLKNSLEYSDQTLHADRYTGAGSQEFVTFRIGAAWKRGKVYGFILSFHSVDFVLAVHVAAKRM